MALGRVWRVCSVWLFLTGTLTLGSEKLQLLQILNTKTLGKLDEMTQEKIHIVCQTLRQTNEIYGMSLGSATWPLKKVEGFRVLLHRQVRVLEECVWNPATESRPKGTIIIEKYFRKLRSFLKHKKFAECAWEIIRTETRACLQQILLIAAKTSRKY
ncbi:interferon omega-1-like [Mobula hypostoma]|uniref:interferon omega-1-like n=1 Tax=Mobula hypostoma TaxID=723540 RepID=UPI002FC293C4